mmetsp:Transcript_17396/g.32785  ORF Transcript_17396/g.32785 Transcript_17396/m.32785 type:complete len:343 (+) Transcript_17396:52-1080(+)
MAGPQGTLNASHFDMMCARGRETESDMASQVYGFCDAQGEFHAFEGPEGRRIVMAMKALEEKILTKVERSFVGMRRDLEQTNAKLCMEVIPAVQKLGTEVITNANDLEQTNAKLCMEVIPAVQKLGKEVISNERYLCSKVDELSMEAFESRSDLLAQIDEISREALESRADLLASVEEIEARMKNTSPAMESLEVKMNDGSAAIQDLENLEMQLDKDIAQANHELDSAQQEDLRNLQAEVCALDQNCEAKEEKKHTAIDLDLSSRHSSEEERKPAFLLQPQDGFYSDALGGALYSSKNTLSAPTSAMFSKKSAPFAHGFNIHRPRSLARMTSSSSTPLLAPL